MKTVLLVVGGIAVLFIVGMLFLRELPKRPVYEGSYWRIVTNPQNISNATIRDVYGDPIEIVKENGNVYAKYSGLSFLLSTDDSNISGDEIFRSIRSVIVTDPKFQFGPKKIGLGSTREEVENAYSGVIRNIDVDCGYHDGDYGVDFLFDENDKVSEILIGQWP